MHGENQPRPIRLLILFLFTDLLINIFSFGLPFFWDTILTSTIAQYFYNNGAGNWIIPIQWNAGHPSFFALYLAGLWKVLGKSLWVSHLAILPFLWLRSWSIWKLGNDLRFSRIQIFSAWLLLLLTPAILTQSMLVSYDIAMLGAFLLALSGIIGSSNWRAAVGSILLVMLSVRGLQVVSALMIMTIAHEMMVKKKGGYLKKMLVFLPAVLLASGWYFYHYKMAGWTIISPSESWAGQRELFSILSVRGQGIAFFRACLEQGSVILWVALFLALWKVSLNKLPGQQLFLALSIFIVLSICLVPLILFTAPVLNRYTMILQALLILAIVAIKFPLKKWLLPLTAIVLCSGHAWIYSGLSNSWDTTLAHIPYYKLREKTFSYLQKEKIEPSKAATHFPLYASFSQTDLTSDTSRLISLHDTKKNLDYLIESNISNDFSEQDRRLIATGFYLDTVFSDNCLFLYVYKRKGL